MKHFWRLLKESVIVQALMTLALVGTAIYLAIAGREIPELIEVATGLALGYYFGSKQQFAAVEARKGEEQ